MSIRRLAGLLSFALLAALLASEAPARESRIVAVGDVHGAYASMLRILGAAGIVDAQARWAGGDATLVQVGDLIDRGPDDRKVLELMMRLEEEARRDSGRVIALLGNHELMNLHGDWRYVSPESLASFADSRSQERIEAAYQQYLELEPLDPTFVPESKESFVARHPPGFIERAEAFAEKGHIGRWLRRRSAVVRIEDTVFVHGGIHPQVASRTVRQINDQIEEELEIFDRAREYLVRRHRILPTADLERILLAARAELESGVSVRARNGVRLTLLGNYPNWLLGHPAGPLWFRGLAEWPAETLAEPIAKVLEGLRTQHVVMGHTPQLRRGIVSRMGGAVYLIDSGILQGEYYPGGAEQALEIVGGRFRVIASDGTRREVAQKAEPGASRSATQ